MKYIGQNLSVLITKIKELMNSHNTSNSAHSALLKSKFDSWVLLRDPTNAEIANALATTHKNGIGDVLVHVADSQTFALEDIKLFFRPARLQAVSSNSTYYDGIYITMDGTQGRYQAKIYADDEVMTPDGPTTVSTPSELVLYPALNDAVTYSSQTLTDAQKQQARENIDAYTKPNDGIPKSDLEADLQKALDNANATTESGVALIKYIKMVDADTTGSGIVVPNNSDETYYTIKEHINSGYTIILVYKGVPYSLNYTKMVNNSISLYYFHAIVSSDATSTVDTASEIKTIMAGNVFRFKVTTKPLYSSSATVSNNTLIIHSGATVSGNVVVIG